MMASDTLILMADSRTPTAANRFEASYFALAAAVNLTYARRHGYDFACYRFGEGGALPPPEDGGWRDRLAWHCDQLTMAGLHHLSMSARSPVLALSRRYGRVRSRWFAQPEHDAWRAPEKKDSHCEHPLYGERSAPWCKLLAIHDAMARGYDRVVYIDSDAVFSSQVTTLDEFLARSASSAAPVATADLIVLCAEPFRGVEATSGFMIWRNSPTASSMLEAWWNHDAGRFHVNHDYEQHPLNHMLLKHPDHRARIAIVPELSFLERKGQLIRHVASPHAWERVPRFRYAARQAGLSGTRLEAVIRDVIENHVIDHDGNSAGRALADPSADAVPADSGAPRA